MMSNISPLNADEIGHTSSADSEAQALLAELRVNFEALKKSAAEMTAEGAKRAGQVAHAGSEQLRTEIRRAPLIALGIAALFGVIIAVAISQPQANRSSYRQVLDRAKRNLPDFDLSGLRDNLYGTI